MNRPSAPVLVLACSVGLALLAAGPWAVARLRRRSCPLPERPVVSTIGVPIAAPVPTASPAR